MKLTRDDLKEISAGTTAVDYGALIKAFIVKLIAFIQNLLSGGSTGGGTGGGTGGESGGGGGHAGGGGGSGGSGPA